jgi:DNA-binding response OmpR family regulator
LPAGRSLLSYILTKKACFVNREHYNIVAVTKTRLESAGYKVMAVETGEDALTCLKKNTPDLILLDLLLPKIQGEEVCKQIKSDEKLKRIPVVLFTASASDIPKVTKEIGADDYIMKHFEPEDLLGKVKKFIG